MSMISEKEEVPSDLIKTLNKPFHKKGDKSECGNYRGIYLVSVRSKLLSIMMFLRIKDAVDKVLRDQWDLRNGRGCVDHIITLRLMIEKGLNHQTPLVLSFIEKK